MGFAQALEGLLKGSGAQQDYGDFVKRYNQGPPSQGYENDEVARRYEQIAPALPPQDYQRAAMEAFERMSPQERSEFAQALQQRTQQQNVQVPGFQDLDRNGVDDRFQDPGTLAKYTTQVQQQKPDILGELLGPGGMLGSTAAKAALAGIAAMAASKFLVKR
jgi:hypothetical protein